jgi:hypothetical protein
MDWLLAQGVLPEHIHFFVSPLSQNADVESQAKAKGIEPQPGTRHGIDTFIRDELITEDIRGDLLYVFWGGHGILTKTQKVSRRLFFADTTAANKLNLDVDSLVDALRTSAHGTGFPRQILLFDACANAYFQGLYETVQGELAGQRYSATGEQSKAEQFVLFAAEEYEVAVNDAKAGTGLFSEAVLAELQGQPLWPNMKALAEQVQVRFREQHRPEPVYWWSKGRGYDTEIDRQSTQVVLSRSQRLKIDRLQTELDDLEQDYETVSTQLRNELDGPTQNKLSRQLEQIGSEIDKREQQLAQLRQING